MYKINIWVLINTDRHNTVICICTSDKRHSLILTCIASTHLKASRGTRGGWWEGMGLESNSPLLILVFKKKNKYIFLGCDFTLKSRGTLPQNSYKPSQEQWQKNWNGHYLIINIYLAAHINARKKTYFMFLKLSFSCSSLVVGFSR